MSTYRLDHLFAPRSIALVGGSPKLASVGSATLRNLKAGGFDGPIDVINRKYPEIDGIRTKRDFKELAHVPDLTIICTPPSMRWNSLSLKRVRSREPAFTGAVKRSLFKP